MEASRSCDSIYVSLNELPFGDNCDFELLEIELPSPQEVRARAEQVGTNISSSRPKPVRFPESGLIVKWGKAITVAEGQCLYFLKEHFTGTVPVPQIYGWKVDEGETFLYMELVQSATLEDRWDHLTELDRNAISDQLQHMISAWRRIKQDPVRDQIGLLARIYSVFASWLGYPAESSPRLSQIGGQPLRDMMFYDGGSYPAGPFANIADFHKWLVKFTLRNNPNDKRDARKVHPELSGLTDDLAVVFTHSDLHPSNILISREEEGPPRIKAIIDWHQSGWYPEPWEWLKSQSIVDRDSDWCKVYLDKILQRPNYEYWYAWEFISMATI